MRETKKKKSYIIKEHFYALEDKSILPFKYNNKILKTSQILPSLFEKHHLIITTVWKKVK